MGASDRGCRLQSLHQTNNRQETQRLRLHKETMDHLSICQRMDTFFSTGTISCPLHVTLSGLLFAGADVCVLEAFGMKMDVDMLKKLVEMQVDEPSLEERVDIGISAYCSGIPLFTCTNRGKVHPLLFMVAFGNSSITVESELNSNTKVRTVVYPTLSHHIKSLLHISYDVSVTRASKGQWIKFNTCLICKTPCRICYRLNHSKHFVRMDIISFQFLLAKK